MHSNNQQGSHHVIIIIAVLIILVVAMGFLFWKNILNKDASDTVANKSTASKSDDKKKVDSVDPVSTSVPQSSSAKTETATTNQSGWIVINQWGVKFKAPTDGTSISWAASNYGGVNTSLGFTTNRLTKGDNCTAAYAAAGALSRDTVKFSQSTAGTTRTFINNGQPINGYYYVFDLPNGQHCDNANPSDYDEALKIQSLIVTLTVV